MKTQYVAFDGTVFEDYAECERYENRHFPNMSKLPVMLNYDFDSLHAKTANELDSIYEECEYLYFRDEEEITNFLKRLDEYFVNQICIKFEPQTVYRYNRDTFSWEDFDNVILKFKEMREKVLQNV